MCSRQRRANLIRLTPEERKDVEAKLQAFEERLEFVRKNYFKHRAR